MSFNDLKVKMFGFITEFRKTQEMIVDEQISDPELGLIMRTFSIDL